MKSWLLTCVVLASSVASSAFAGAKVGVSYGYSPVKKEQKSSVGLGLGLGLMPALAWTSWTGGGLINKDNGDVDSWFETQQGLEVSAAENFKFGPFVDFKYEKGSDRWDTVIGGKVSATLW